MSSFSEQARTSIHTIPHESNAESSLLRPQDLRRYRNMLFAAKMVVEGFYAGKHRSPFHDFSAEFADYRPYALGDEIRAVDWKAAARSDRLYVKLYRKETDMSGYIVVDKSASMEFAGEADVSKLTYCSYLAAAICYLMLKQGDKPSLSLVNDGLRSYLPPRGTMKHLYGMLYGLEKTAPEGETNMAQALRELFPLARKRGLLVVMSDFLEDPEQLFYSLGMYLHRGFTVLLLQVLTDEELNLSLSGTAQFTNPEGPGTLDADPDAVRAAYCEEVRKHLDTLAAGAKARCIHYQLAPTSAPYHQALSTYLSARGNGG